MRRITLVAVLLIPLIAEAQSKQGGYHCIGHYGNATYYSAVFPYISDGRHRSFGLGVQLEWENMFRSYLVEYHDLVRSGINVHCEPSDKERDYTSMSKG